MIFHEYYVRNEDILEIPSDALCLSIHTDQSEKGIGKTFVTWLEEVPLEIPVRMITEIEGQK